MRIGYQLVQAKSICPKWVDTHLRRGDGEGNRTNRSGQWGINHQPRIAEKLDICSRSVSRAATEARLAPGARGRPLLVGRRRVSRDFHFAVRSEEMTSPLLIALARRRRQPFRAPGHRGNREGTADSFSAASRSSQLPIPVCSSSMRRPPAAIALTSRSACPK